MSVSPRILKEELKKADKETQQGRTNGEQGERKGIVNYKCVGYSE